MQLSLVGIAAVILAMLPGCAMTQSIEELKEEARHVEAEKSKYVWMTMTQPRLVYAILPLPHAFFLTRDRVASVVTDGQRYVIAVGTVYHDLYQDYNDQLYIIDGNDGRLLHQIVTGSSVGSGIIAGDGFVAYQGSHPGLLDSFSRLFNIHGFDTIVVRRLPDGWPVFESYISRLDVSDRLAVAGPILRIGREEYVYVDGRNGKKISSQQAQEIVEQLILEGKVSADQPWREAYDRWEDAEEPTNCLKTEAGERFVTHGLYWIAASSTNPSSRPSPETAPAKQQSPD